MTEKSFSFRTALDEIKYLQSTDGSAESLFQKIVSNMKKYNIPVVCVDEIFICLKKYDLVMESYRIHVTYAQKGGDFKQRICDKEILSCNIATATMKKVEEYLNQEKFEVIDITLSSKEKDKNIIKMLKVKI